MAEGRIKNTELSAIAAAIRQKSGTNTTYKPGQMAAAIEAIPTGTTPTGTVNITQNGTTDVTQYASAAVNVPNSYGQSDEGKVVSNGALVAQTARSAAITQNGTYDTTNNNEITVNVSGGGGGLVIEYQQVEYLASADGNAAIPLDILLQDVASVELDFEISTLNNTGIYCGARALSMGNRGSVLFVTNSVSYTSSSVTIATGRHSLVWNISSSASVSVKLDNAEPVSLTLGQTSSHEKKFYVMSGNPVNSGIGLFGKLYSAKVYDSNHDLICNAVPCRKADSSEVGLFDTVRTRFFANAGAGTLTAGPDVQ